MKDFWKRHYVVGGNPERIAAQMSARSFTSRGDRFELVSFERGPTSPSILISQGSGGHALVFAELGHSFYRRGYNVFIMPKHGGHTVPDLMQRERDALDAIASAVGTPIGVYAEGLGGYVSFYLALSGAPLQSLVCENGPALMDEPSYHAALLSDGGPWASVVHRRRALLPFIGPLARLAPWLRIPISSYLDWRALIDPRSQTERRLVEQGYLEDPDFDRWYPLSHVASLVSTQPPAPLDELRVPTMFIVASCGPTPGYVRDLFRRLPKIPRRLTEVDGSVYWMLSHVEEAADLVCGWFDETIAPKVKEELKCTQA